ncbi:MAG: nuclease [Caulobacter sp.]|nr:nuclease [Caulobacter sp.]
MAFYTYILASAPAGTLYTGSTDNLIGRLSLHREKSLAGFTATYGVTRLVWFEEHGSRHEAFCRERRIKEWRRRWKIELIERENPYWRDLYDVFFPPCVLPEGLLSDPSSAAC